MKHVNFCGNDISILALGAACLPDDKIKAEQIFRFAIAEGVNLVEASPVLSDAFASTDPNGYYVMSGTSVYDHDMNDSGDFITAELKTLHLDHFDYYVISDINEMNVETYLDPDQPLMKYLIGEAGIGRISHLGVRLTGRPNLTEEFFTRSTMPVEFCTVDTNCLDWYRMGSWVKTMNLKMLGVPVMAVRPMHGGVLVRDTDWFYELTDGSVTPASWCLRWAMGEAAGEVILSDVSNTAELKENIGICNAGEPLPAEEAINTIRFAEAVRDYKAYHVCITCGHCMPYCPQNLEIPLLMEILEAQFFEEDQSYIRMYREIPEDKNASACIGCGQCLSNCGEQIDIPKRMKKLITKIHAVSS